VTSGSGRTLSDVSLRTVSVVSEPPGYVPRIVARDHVELYANGSDFSENDFSGQGDLRNTVAASKSYSDASRHFEAQLIRLIPREPVQQLSGTRPTPSHSSRRAVPEGWSSGYVLDMRSGSTSQAQPSHDSMVSLVSTRAKMTGTNMPIGRAARQEMHPHPTQSLHTVSEQRQQVQPQMRTSASLQYGGNQPNQDVYQDQFTEKSSNAQRGRTQVQSTVPVLNPVVNAARPTVLSWVQQEQPRSHPVQRHSYGTSHLPTGQQKLSDMSKDSYIPFLNNSPPGTRQTGMVSQSFANHPVGSPSTVQTAAYRPMPAEAHSDIPETSRSQFWTPNIPRPPVFGDSEPSDRLRERQNKPITPPRPTQVQPQQAGYARSIQVPQSGPVMQMQSSLQRPTRQTLQQPSSDPRRQRFCEICRSNGSQPSGFVCYHVSISPLAIVLG